MPAETPPDLTDDLSALSWVQDELRRALELANKAMRRYLKEMEAASDLDTVDPAVLRQARSQLHQSVGVLELVSLGRPALVLRAAEAALQRLSQRPRLITLQAVHTLEHGSFAVLDYIARRLTGKPVSTLSLFPQYRALQELAGNPRVHPCDLWEVDWSWRSLPADPQVSPRHADQEVLEEIEAGLLMLMRGAPQGTAARMSDLFAGLGVHADHRLATLWRLAAGFFEAVADGLLSLDVYSKRVGSRLLSQLRAGDHGEPSERLAHDMLFFCGQASHKGGRPYGPRLKAVRSTYALPDIAPTDLEVPRLGRFDPAWVAQARKRINAAKDVWSAVAGGDTERLGLLAEQFSLVADSLQRLYPDGAVLGRALQVAVAQTAASGREPPAELAMEVATALLYVDASIDDADFDHPDTAPRVNRLAQRIEQVRQGRNPGMLELWMEELYRRVSDRQTMGSVVQELRASLSEVEKNIDQYFRDPSQRQVLIPVPAQMQAMRGVLSVLGLDQASAAVLRMRDDIDALASTEVDPHQAISAGTFDRLADNLGALSFLIDMVSVQPQMAKSLFRFDPATGNLTAVVAREDRPTGFDALETAPDPAAAASQDTDALAVSLEFDRLVKHARTAQRTGAVAASLGSHGLPLLHLDEATGEATMRLQPRPTTADEDEAVTMRLPTRRDGSGLAPVPAGFSGEAGLPSLLSSTLLPAESLDISEAPTMRIAPPAEHTLTLPLPRMPEQPAESNSGLEDDAEMREVFLEEARDVIATARDGMHALQTDPLDHAAITTVRRAFHTLKGSSRMVGLRNFGEAAWSCEQLYNARLSEHLGVDGDLREFTLEACDYFERWVHAIASGNETGYWPQVLARPADALRLERRRLPIIETPQGADASGHTELPLPALNALQQRVPGLPAAVDLDLLPVPDSTDSGELTSADLTLDALDLAPALPADVVAGQAIAPALPELDLNALDADWPTEAVPPDPVGMPQPPRDEPVLPVEAFKQVGPLRIGIPLFNIYLNEADELSRRLVVELSEWALELHRPVGDTAVALAHSLAGGSGTVGFVDLSHLARNLEHALGRSQSRGHGNAAESALFSRAADEVRRLLHLFAAGFLNAPDAGLVQALHDIAHAAPDAETPDEDVDDYPLIEGASAPPKSAPAPLSEATPLSVDVAPPVDVPELAAPVEVPLSELGRTALTPFAQLVPQPPARQPQADVPRFDSDIDDDIDAVDVVDAELFPIFVDEATELLAKLDSSLRDWAQHPAEASAATACMRSLHTFKGGARLAGAMRLGEMAHRLESAVTHLAASAHPGSAEVEQLQMRVDALDAHFDSLRRLASEPLVDTAAPAEPPVAAGMVAPHHAPALPTLPAATEPARRMAPPSQERRPAPARRIDWQRFGAAPLVAADGAAALRGATGGGTVRVRAALLDRLVNQAGEVSIARSRIETEVQTLKSAFGDLNDNLERLRSQLRDIELQAETQIATRMEAARSAAKDFDPLEMDRFTRFQELTRMMAESVSDVATVQRGLQRAVQSAEDALAHQARMTHDMQDDLLRTRMVEFEGLSDRLYRVVRQASKETSKPVRLDIVGGSIEMDRGVLDRMMPAFEHLLRNGVVHGIESADQRVAAGKDATGTITISLSQVGNEVVVEVRDDGAGLNLPRIHERARALGLIPPGSQPTDADLANLVFQAGFTTTDRVTDLAGRGVGMDVVRTEVNAMGGRIETASAPGQGASFRLVLPLTTAVTQVVMLRCGARSVAVPATLVEIVRRVPAAELAQAYADGQFLHGGQTLPFHWFDALLQGSARGQIPARTGMVAVIRSAAQRVALHVDEVVANQEVVVKNLGPQLSKLAGLVGMTLLASGLPSLIYNPVALATLYGDSARARTIAAQVEAEAQIGAQLRSDVAAALPKAPLVMVVDDSLTVRRVTQRLLEREGYRVLLAKDGLDALERLDGELPSVVLTDIEMPRMDGFDLVRNMKVHERLARLPLIMITSRIAQKHRDYAAELGVEHYLGKPYAEDELLALVAHHAQGPVPVT